MFKSIAQIVHQHTWSEWVESSWNKHPWSHTVAFYRYCQECSDRQERVTEVHCRHFIRTGEYCSSCKPYAEDWEKRTIDFSQRIEDNGNMKTGKRKIGRPAHLAKCIAMAIEYEWYPPISERQVGEKYGVGDPGQAHRFIVLGRQMMNKEAVEGALKRR